MFEIIQNRKVAFGLGSLEKAKEIVSSFRCNKVFILTYSSESYAVNQITSELRSSGIKFYLCDLVKHEPDIHIIDTVAEILLEQKCDCVLAIGGGSVLDAAKAIAMIGTNGGSIEEYQMHNKMILNPTLPLILIPTTAGTGSEASKVSVIYNNNNHLKKSVYSPYMIAEYVILDPLVTTGLPSKITASTGIDALSHAIESYVSLNANPYTEMYSLKALELINKSLLAAVTNGKNMEARTDLLYASYFAGCALNAGIGLAHIIAQPIGGLLNIPHGEACSVFLPYSMEYNREYSQKKYCDIARVLGSDSKENDSDNVDYAINKVNSLIKDVNGSTNIKPYLNDEFNLDDAVKIVHGATMHIQCNPRPVTIETIKQTIRSAM